MAGPEDSTDQKEQKSRRFRIGRRVKTEPVQGKSEPPVRPYSEQVMREVETDEADPGTPEMGREVGRGCMGCFNVTLLVFLIMLASIVATFFITRRGV